MEEKSEVDEGKVFTSIDAWGSSRPEKGVPQDLQLAHGVGSHANGVGDFACLLAVGF